MKRFIAAFMLLALVILGLSACEESARDEARHEAEKNRRDFVPYIPRNGVEGANYNRIQEIADDPSTVLWCTPFPPSSTAPIVTVPIVGKLTSSSVSAFNGESSSVDGLYHGHPPPYRFGFTPGGQLVSFENIPTICTTAVMAFQRQSISVSIDGSLQTATKRAEKELRRKCGETVLNKPCSSPEAQAVLEAAAGSSK